MNAGTGAGMKRMSNTPTAASLTRFQFANAVTVAYTQPAAVVNLGTPTAPVLQFSVPRGAPGDFGGGGGGVGNVAVELAVLGNVTVGGLLLSSKAGIVTGLGGGPRITQGGWDSPAATHTLAWTALADGCDNVTGVLTVHASSKGTTTRKNGVATATVVKDYGSPPELMVTALHASSRLQSFDLGVSGNDVVVLTDAACSVCWTFVAAV